MRILLVHDYSPQYGGAEVLNASLVSGLQRRGHDVRRLTSSAGLDDSSPPSPQRPEYVCRGTLSRWRTVLQSANPWAPGVLRRALADFKPDIVHVHIFETQLSPLILPILRDVPAVYHAAWYRAVCPTGLKYLPNGQLCTARAGAVCVSSGCIPARDWLPLTAQRQLLRRWRGVFRTSIANSAATANYLRDDGIADITVIPNGVPAAPARSVMAARPTVLFVGRLVREKGVDTLLRAFADVRPRVPQATLDIVGDGTDRAALEALARELGLESAVRFHGTQSRDRTEAIAQSAWVQIVPSRWAEPFGLVATEAMMRGTAVVASDSGGLSEIVRHERSGLLVPPDDALALRDAMYRVLSDRALAAQWGQSGHEVAHAEYNHDTFLDRILDVYATVLS